MLPETYREFARRYGNMPYINIMCDSPMRIYYNSLTKTFHCFISCIEGIIPIESKIARYLADSINNMIKGCNTIDLSFHYPMFLEKNKQKKIHALSGEYSGDYRDLILQYLLLLI